MENTFLPRRFNPIIRLIIAFLAYEVLNNAFLLPLVFLLSRSGTEPSRLQMNLIRIVFGVVVTLVYFLLTKKVDRRSLKVLDLKLDSNAFKGFVISFLLAGLLVVISAVISNSFFADKLIYPGENDMSGLIQGFFAAFFLQGIPEEVAFRGYMPQTTEKDPIPTFLITSILFMLFHWQHFGLPPFDAFAEFSYPLMFGALAFVLRYLTKSTWAAVGVHSGIHMVRNFTEYFGYDDGPVRSLITAILMMIVIIIIFVWKREVFRPENNRIPNQ